MATPMSNAEAVAAEIDRIRSLPITDLRALWRQTFGATAPPSLGRDLLARMIAYQMQEQAFGGLNRETGQMLDRLAGGKPAERRRLKAGTVLVREYQGGRHTVTVVPGGFCWRGTIYPSLSTIARAITGTAWSGPRFFGLRDGGDDPGGPDDKQSAKPHGAEGGRLPTSRQTLDTRGRDLSP